MDIKTKAQIISETLAKLHFELLGYYVYTNSSGKAEFDMLLSRNKKVYSVEVKSVSTIKTSIKGEYFDTSLRSIRSNTKVNNIYLFNNESLDYLAVVNVIDNKIKVFQANEITTTSGIRIYRKDFMSIGEELMEATGVGSLSGLENRSTDEESVIVRCD